MCVSLCQVLLLFVCLLVCSSSKGKQTLTFGTAIAAPFVSIDPESGRCTGHMIELVRKMFADSDFRLKFICVPISRMYRIFDNNEIDLTAGGKKISQPEGLVTFVDPPYRES